jgi:hypothetical protein
MTQITFCESLKPTFAMLHNSPWQIASEPHIQHPATVRDEIDIEHLLCKISTHPPISLPVPLPLFSVLTSHNPKPRHFDRRRRTCRRSGEICICSCLFSFPHTQTPSFRPKAAHLPPQRRNLHLQLLVFLPTHSNSVISTEGGALAAAVEKSAFVCFPPTTQIHFGSGSGSTVLIPGKIVEVALNFR